jgi:hypothetical protein
MRSHLATPMFLALSFTICAQTSHDPEEVLVQARDKILERTERLPNYTCVQTVNRTYLKVDKPQFPVPSCDDLNAKRNKKAYTLKVEATDRLRLDVKVSGGTEIGAWAGSSHFEDGNVMKLIQGPFGTGPFGTFLDDIFTGPSVRFDFQGEEPLDGVKLYRYRFAVTRDASHYMVHAGSEWVYTGYDGDVWIDPRTLELRRLTVRTGELPEETTACESTTTVDYASMRIGTGEFLLPQRSSLHFLMRDMGESDVAIAYSGCHQFHGEANLITDPSAIAKESEAPHRAISIPEGLLVPIKLSHSIDTDTAAAGDVVVARVSGDVRDPKSGEAVMKDGSIVRGRIVLMLHMLNTPRSFRVSIQIETVEINGIPSPLYAMRPAEYEKWTVRLLDFGLVERSRPIFLSPRGQSRLVTDFSFFTKARHYVIPRGYEMKWITVVAPAPANP